MQWDDLRFLVEIGRCGSLAAASRRLRVDQTTVARRLRALERRLGATLFERIDGRWIATALGVRVLERVEGIEESVAGIQRIAASGSRTVAGTVRVTSIASIAIGYLAPRLPSLYARHPALTVDLIESNDNLSISRREADIAIRLARPDSGDFLIRKLVDCGLALYVSADVSAARAAEDCWVAYREDLAQTPEMRWLEQHRDGGRIRLHSNSPGGLAAAIAGGVGRGILPCFLGDAWPGLRRLSGREPLLNRPLWLLSHREARRQPGVSAVAQWLTECFEADASSFVGVSPRDPAPPRRRR
jgi:DNA-binding transcriptional LysR family regulator